MLLIHGKKDTLVGLHNTQNLSAAITRAGGAVKAVYFAEMDHNAPLLALASPWRRDRKLLEAVAEFAAPAPIPANGKPSVPVQAQTR